MAYKKDIIFVNNRGQCNNKKLVNSLSTDKKYQMKSAYRSLALTSTIFAFNSLSTYIFSLHYEYKTIYFVMRIKELKFTELITQTRRMRLIGY